MSAGRAGAPLRIARGNSSQQRQSEDSKRIMAPRYCGELASRNCRAAGSRANLSSVLFRSLSAASAFSSSSQAAGSSPSWVAAARALRACRAKASNTPSSTAVCTMRASAWPAASCISWEKSIGNTAIASLHTSKKRARLKLFDDPVAAALRFERRDDAVFHHDADFPIGRVAVHLGEALVLRRRKSLAVAVGVGEEPALAQIDLARVELVEPAQGRLVVNRRVAQRDGENKAVGGKLGRVQAVALHLLKHARHAFAHLAQVAEIGERAHEQRVARKVNALLPAQLLQRDRRRRQAGAAHGDMIVEHP